MESLVGRVFPVLVLTLVVGRIDSPVLLAADTGDEDRSLTRLKYNNPGLVVDLGVGLWAWPIPMDFDGDGDLDLVVSCPDKPYNGTYLFENPGGKDLVFKPGRRIADGTFNIVPSYVDGRVRVLLPGKEVVDLAKGGLADTRDLGLPANIHPNRVRANQWRYVDYDGDGALDLIVGVGDWTEYGWDNAFDENGNWTRGPLHGWVYLIRNKGTTEDPQYAEPVKVLAGGEPVDVYGMPSPNLADFDGDGDLDLLCGEFIDGFTYFENTGTRTTPEYAAGRRVTHDGSAVRMELCMIIPVAVDWDGDGDVDLVVGQEDGRVAFLEHTGETEDGVPVFMPPRFFRQEADEVKFGALVTPVGFDWDGDGDDDLVCGNTAGHIGFIENLDGGCPPKFAAPKLVEADGGPIRIMAGPNGSIQGPCEAKWGYTTLGIADWDGDGLPDILANSIWGKVVWFRNVGTRTQPKLAPAEPVRVTWSGTPPKPAWTWWNPGPTELAPQWRTTPVPYDYNGDGLVDLVMLDHEGYLAFYERRREGDSSALLPPVRVFTDEKGNLLHLNPGIAGKSGRRKLCLVDFDGDGKVDLLANSVNADFLRNISTENGRTVLENKGPVSARRLAGHTTSPTVVEWNRDGRPELVIGAEDGYFYYYGASQTEGEKR